MRKRLVSAALAAAMALSMTACTSNPAEKETEAAAPADTEAAEEGEEKEAAADGDLITVGYAQVGAESDWRTANTESFKSTLDEVRDADLLVHVVDISHPSFEEQIEIVNQTLHEVCNSSDKPMIIVFNKIDAFSYVEKDPDDLSPKTKKNISLDELKETWMARMNENCIFISAKEKNNIEELKKLLYERVKEIHVTRFPYNDFLFQKYDEEENI